MKHLVAVTLAIVCTNVLGQAQPSTLEQAQYSASVTQSPPVRGDVSGGPDCTAGTSNPFTNCSFETGDFSGWVVTDFDPVDQFFPASVVAPGTSTFAGFFLTEPTQGAVSALTGFDGNGPGTIEIAQDISLPEGSETIRFDFRAAGDLGAFGALLDRDFIVEVQPTGGGAALQSEVVFSLLAGALVEDSGIIAAEVDVSGFATQDVRIAFILDVPEPFSGPAQLELDNVSVGIAVAPPVVPVLSPMGLLLIAAALLAIGLLTVRQRRRS